ncbi:hypothetical protein G3H63_10840 [Microbacterium resistens]|uniref:hypothetical protein n=1 Tax=Microbacterium resistens TaxID=156977 RepID=UPI001C58BA48|nr:hypothetical protein [Microbacterium resistens]MBW1639562.1 hypothetical protein [Microbacterium resistens]
MFHDFACPSPVPADVGWTWEATATIIQAVATVVALAGVGITFFYSLRSERREHEKTRAEAQHAAEQNQLAREEAERSQASAERAERAAALSIDTMGRIADGIEALVRSGFPSAGPIMEPKRVRWSLRHFNGDTYILTNDGNQVACDVRVTADPTLMTPGELPEPQDMRPNDSVTFMAAATLGTRDKTITVTWRGGADDADEDVWRYPLPPRPPRT